MLSFLVLKTLNDQPTCSRVLLPGALALGIWLPLPSLAQLDLDSDGLSDIWQQTYGAVGLSAAGDDDADGFTNLEEAIAGTDPFSAEDCPQLKFRSVPEVGEAFTFGVPTKEGKTYQLEESVTLGGFRSAGEAILGTGGEVQLELDPDGDSQATGIVHYELWKDVQGTEIEALDALASFPGSADGVSRLRSLEAPRTEATGYAGRVRTLFTAPESGNYTFYLSSGSAARLLLSSDSSVANLSQIAAVSGAEDDIELNSFQQYEGQQSEEVSLVAGESYYIEVHHLATRAGSHLQVAWAPPGVTEPQLLPASVLTPVAAGTDAGGIVINPDEDYFRIAVSDGDQDGDGLTDWEEQVLARHQPFLFFDSDTGGGDDLQRATQVFNNLSSDTMVTLQASDVAAFERASSGPSLDDGEIIITRTGSLQELTVELCIAPLEDTGNTATVCDGTCCSLVGTAGAEEAEVNDYQIIDADGNVVGSSVTFGFGEMTKVLRVRALPDDVFEYPETLNVALQEPTSDRYEISESLNGASIQLFDLPDDPGNEILLTGIFGPEPGVTSAASGSISATLNGPRTKLTITTNFIEEDLTSAQQDSHVHKSLLDGVGAPAPGPIIFEIVTLDSEGEEIPLNGLLEQHVWDISMSAGATPTAGGANSKQTVIDSLFGQNGESPLYLNIHTVNNPGGEIWAFFSLAGGSQNEPPAPDEDILPGSESFPQLVGTELEAEVRRFLNQATFGATEETVTALVDDIESERATDPDYHRNEAFETWMDEQMALPQSYHLDYVIASSWQTMALAGTFDSGLNPGGTPARPNVWPQVNRDAADPEHWYLDRPFPVTFREFNDAEDNDLRPGITERTVRNTHWQMMINARDQLRQKMGFALQQIVVVSLADGVLDRQFYGMANYQDQLNINAFNHYRDVLGYVNWSPLMGRYLSSLQNQKATDLDGDGEFDIFPDENLARENMQLFSIGLFEIWPDGSLRLGADGLPIPTYTNEDIQEFAKVLTGQSFGRFNFRNQGWGGVPYDQQDENRRFDRGQNPRGQFVTAYSYPMVMFGEFHDLSVKSFAGTVIDNTSITDPTEQGIADIEDAIDWLAGKPGDGQPDFDMVNSHRSVPAFISRRLIQRFVTSNPSTDYLHRVATVFRESEGDLGLTLRAILLDSEARVPSNSISFGMKKSPLEGYVQAVRAMDAFTQLPITNPQGASPFDNSPVSYSNPDVLLTEFGLPASQVATQVRNMRFLQATTFTQTGDGLMMDPMSQETVFNWYVADYTPGGPITEAGLVAPEFQLANEQDVIRNINWMENLSRSTRGNRGDFLGERQAVQRRAFGATGNTANFVTRTRIDATQLAREIYPSSPPAATETRTSESLADEMMLDELDRRLTLGWFKEQNPYDPTDDFDPAGEPGNDDLRNRRELILDALSSYNNPFDGSRDSQDRRDKVRDALYLLTLTAEYQVKK